MRFRNRTDFSTRFIIEAMVNGMQDGVKIAAVIIKNKKFGIAHGNYGKYYPRERKVTLTVPRFIPKGFKLELRYSRKWIVINGRDEFIVAIMAHELRHAWQWQVNKKYLGNNRMDRKWREIDCEGYESVMLAFWRQSRKER